MRLCDLDGESREVRLGGAGVATTEEALQGASDILAEEVSEKAEIRRHLREFLLNEGWFVSRIKEDHAPGTTKFEMYRDFKARVKDIAPHSMLALRRGEAEGIVIAHVDVRRGRRSSPTWRRRRSAPGRETWSSFTARCSPMPSIGC